MAATKSNPRWIGGSKNGKQTTLYVRYRKMIDRCFKPNDKNFKHYGGRGITVCSRWVGDLTGFRNFRADMGDDCEGLCLDRIDVNGNYEPTNCRWATTTVSAINIRARVDNKSGFRGVYIERRSGKYHAGIQVNGKKIKSKGLATAIEAAKYYDTLAKQHHGEFAVLNFAAKHD